MIDLGVLGGDLSLAIYVNNEGQVVGMSTTSADPDPFSFLGAPTHTFIWEDGKMTDLGTLGGPDSFSSAGCANQRKDLVAGFSYINSTPNETTGVPTQTCLLWENSTMLDIPTLGGTLALAQCANSQGQIIGQSNLSGDVGCDGSPDFCVQHAFFWDEGTLTDLGTLGGSSSFALWLNNAGDIVGGATTPDDDAVHATLWNKGEIRDLGAVNGDGCSFANAINGKGQVVGVSLSCATGRSARLFWRKVAPWWT